MTATITNAIVQAETYSITSQVEGVSEPITVVLPVIVDETEAALRERVRCAVSRALSYRSGRVSVLASRLVGTTCVLDSAPPAVSLTRNGNTVSGRAAPGTKVLLRVRDSKGERELKLAANRSGRIDVWLSPGTESLDSACIGTNGIDGAITQVGQAS